MVYAGGSIEALLKLDIAPFSTALKEAIAEVNKFKTALSNSARNVNNFYQSTTTLNNALTLGSKAIEKFSVEASKLKQFTSFANGVNNLAKALRTLSSEEISAWKSMNIINNMFKMFQSTLNGTELKIGAVVTSIKGLTNSTNVESNALKINNSLIEQNSIAMQKRGAEILRNMGYTGKLSIENDRATASIQKMTNASNMATASTTKQTSATRKLYMALSSIRTMGFLASSMLVYNFASNLVTATRETVNAKSEMEGYFKMLHFSTDQVNNFNRALDETVKKFPRLNKYALGETISSIGVEFELTTQEMEKAMPVVSMITSEYLRAGRNVNEASLAVKDILQGEFQRLSRETGVKGDQLKEAGWSGDKTDVMGLLDALKKVGESRNWDTFVVKANSLNDAVLILQNRFSEWSADMVNAVQPTILSVFNNLMSFGQGMADSLSGIWKWLNGSGWGQSATKIGLVTTAILTLMPALTSFRSGAKLLQVANMTLTQSIGALVFGLNAETLATHTSSESIAMHLLGIKEEELEKTNLVAVINGMIASRSAESVATDVGTASNLGFTGGLYAMILGEEIAEGTTISLTGALGLLSGAFLTSPIGLFTLAVLGLASAFYVLTGGLSDTWEKTKEFNEIMKDTGSAQKQADQYLEQVKNDAGETSDEFSTASDEVKRFKQELQSASYWYKHSQTEFEGLDITIGSTSKDVLGEYGISEEQAEKWNSNLDLMQFGKDRYYKAEQVLNKQIKGEESNYAKDMEEYLADVKKNGGDLEEAYGKMRGNYENLAKHSYIANTSDDWWEKSWNQLYAGMDQAWIDLDKLLADPLGEMDFTEWDNFWKEASDSLSSGWKWISDGLADWQKGARDFLKPLDDFGDEVNKFLNDPLGYLHIQEGIDWASSIFDSMFDLSSYTDNDDPLTQLITGWFSNFEKYDFNDLIGDFDLVGKFLDAILPSGVSASDGSTDHPSFMEDVSAILGFDIQTWITNFTSDPLGTLGIDLGGFNIGTLIESILGGGSSGVGDVDPISTYVNDLMTNLSTGIIDGISNIPIVGSIAEMLGLVPSENENAYQTGYNLIDNLKRGVEQKISEIPIISDIAQMLGLIPSQNGNANAKGEGIGSNIKEGEKKGHDGTSDNVRTEMDNIIKALSEKAGAVYSTAMDIGNRIVNGIKDAMDMHSPSIISRELIPNEFGVYIPNAINEASATAYESAYQYGQQIRDGISSTNFDTVGFDSAVGEYQDDAQIVANSSYLMGTQTTTAFNDMTMSVNQSTNQMQSNVVGTYSQIQSKQASSLNSMKTQNIQAYQDMHLKSNQSLIQMRDSTTNVTHQMTQAWAHMKDQIVATANRLKTDSTNHFNQLSSTIGTFYGKIQNPSRWGAGTGSSTNVRGARSTSGRSIARAFTRHGAGSKGSKYSGSSTMTVAQAKKLFCPNGDCANIFDGYSMNDKIDVNEFLANISGEHGFGWNGWNVPHYNHIKTTSDAWSMKSPMINLAGGIPTNANFKVGEFNNGTPKVSFSTFQSIAGSIFSAIPYKHYMDSSWKGSWLGALQAGACNCSDGADALIALASVFGFSGYKQWGKWGKEGHFWAVINGTPMDTTAWQGGYGWTSPKVHGYGSPNIRTAHPSNTGGEKPTKTVNITVSMDNSVIYGVDDLDSRIQESVEKGLQSEFNDSYSVAI